MELFTNVHAISSMPIIASQCELIRFEQHGKFNINFSVLLNPGKIICDHVC